jgi:GH43 family beta-xylosidase
VAEDVTVSEEKAASYFTEAEQDVLYHPERYRVKLKVVEWAQGWFQKIEQ